MLIIGYTTRDHLCLDVDQTSYFKIVKLTKLLMKEYPELGDALIMESSKGSGEYKLIGSGRGQLSETVDRDNYHVIFDNIVPYEFSCHIIETLAEMDILNREYVRIRAMRNDMTLRVSPSVLTDYTKPKPRIAKRVLNKGTRRTDRKIGEYALFYHAANSFWNSCARCSRLQSTR